MAKESKFKSFAFFIFIIVLGIGGSFATDNYVQNEKPLIEKARNSALDSGRENIFRSSQHFQAQHQEMN